MKEKIEKKNAERLTYQRCEEEIFAVFFLTYKLSRCLTGMTSIA